MAKALITVASLAVLVGTPVATLAGWPPEMQAKLNDADVIYVATRRESGQRSTAAPVWFAEIDGVIWINTSATSHKARRVKRGSPVFVAVEKDGPFVEADAQIVTDGVMANRLGQLYKEKYWIAWMGFFRPSASRVQAGKTVLIKITPEAGGEKKD